MSFKERLQHGWNAFINNKDPTVFRDRTPSYSVRLDRPRFTRGNDRTIVTAIYNRIAMDVASVRMNHVVLDTEGRYIETKNSKLNNCLTLEANIDQTNEFFIRDLVITILDEGAAAIVPIETTLNPNKTMSYDIATMRVGKILEWKAKTVRVQVYNEITGYRQEKWLSKENIGVIENPLYAVINEPNSVLQRLINKLRMLDAVDEIASTGKLDLIIQLPYTLKSGLRKEQAEERRNSIIKQLSDSRYGVAYTDSTEHITQLNRPVENNLMTQIEYLTNMLYSQLCIDQTVLNGTADSKTMQNYMNRTIEPFVSAITKEMTRKFLSKTARTQGQAIMAFNDPFKLVPADEMANIANTYTRNGIMTANEFRQKLGMTPSTDPNADMLINSNISQDGSYQNEGGYEISEEGDGMNYEQSGV